MVVMTLQRPVKVIDEMRVKQTVFVESSPVVARAWRCAGERVEGPEGWLPLPRKRLGACPAVFEGGWILGLHLPQRTDPEPSVAVVPSERDTHTRPAADTLAQPPTSAHTGTVHLRSSKYLQGRCLTPILQLRKPRRRWEQQLVQVWALIPVWTSVLPAPSPSPVACLWHSPHSPLSLPLSTVSAPPSPPLPSVLSLIFLPLFSCPLISSFHTLLQSYVHTQRFVDII